MGERVKLVRDGFVARVTIDRPDALNALNAQVLAELEDAFGQIATSDARAVILTGAGEKAFVAGADIVQMSAMDPAGALAYAERGHALMDRIESLPQAVIAAVNGFALGGGCELALACDVIYASSKARFGQPEVKLGLMPGFGGAVRLPRKVGPGAAAEWILTGEIYSAERAKAIGLVQEVFSPQELMPESERIAHMIAQRAPLAVASSKRVLNQGRSIGQADAASLEREAFAQLFESQDMREGTRAFIEKREPNFEGA